MSQKNPYSLHDLLITKVKALYDVEEQLVKSLPKMADAATDPDLKQAFKDHLVETKNQVKRLEEVFKHLEVAPSPLTSDAIRGLVADAEWVIENVAEGPARDAGLIAAAQYVENFEIAGYGTASEWARIMNHTEIQDLLETTSEEEKMADQKLSNLATSKINQSANTMREDEKNQKESFLGKMQTGSI